jgi:hypothetical protein
VRRLGTARNSRLYPAVLEQREVRKMAESGKQAEHTSLKRSPTDDRHPAVDGHAVRDLDKALLGGESQQVGRYEHRYGDGSWTWSDTVARMHGYEFGEMEPTTELILSHKHPDDLARVKGLLPQSAAPFSSRHRIRTTTGDIRQVVVVGDAVTDAEGRIVATRGFYIDITESYDADLQETITDRLQVIVSHREVIAQAKGMLMLIYQISADAAFALLKWRSQESNVKLSTLAQKLVADLPDLISGHPAMYAQIDHYLLTFTSTG